MQTQPPPPSSFRRPRKDPEKHDDKPARSVQVGIGRALKDVYARVVEEPVPERFVRLLEAIEAKERNE